MTRSTLRLATTLLFAWVFSACPDPNQPCGEGLVRGASGQCEARNPDLCNAIQVVAGFQHSCALVDPVNLCTASGATVTPTWPSGRCTVGREIRCWGQNASGQLGTGDTNPRLTPTTVSFPTPQGSMPVRGFVQVAVGNSHTCALTVGGTVHCWGADGVALGGSTREREVQGLSDVVEIAAGTLHTCARLLNGEVRCWGQGGFGQLGDGANRDNSTPVAVRASSTGTANLTGVVEIGAGLAHSCARLLNGEVRCWGTGITGQLGNGESVYNSLPVAVRASSTGTANLTGVVEIAVGATNSCARLVNGEVRCWGYGPEGQLGNGANGVNGISNTPVAVRASATGTANLTGVVEIAVGRAHGCARLMNGEVRCWGQGGFGQLGDGANRDNNTPVAVRASSTGTANLTGVVEITAGATHSCARFENGSVRCWGENIDLFDRERDYNPWPQLGDGTRVPRTGPAAPVLCCTGGAAACASGCVNLQTDVENCGTCGNRCPNGNRCTAGRCELVPPARGGLAVGRNHTCALRGPTNARELVCWGSSFVGELGIPAEEPGDRCTPVAGLSDVQQVVANGAYSCVLRTGGTVRCFGYDGSGQLGGSSVSQDIPGLVGVTALSAGSDHVCAIRAGQVRCWGSSEVIAGSSTTTDIPDLDRVTAVSAGNAHTCVIREGRVRCWGQPLALAGSSTTTDIVGLDKVTAIAAGDVFTCALRDDNNVRSVLCWGVGRRIAVAPQAVSGLQGVTAIAAGYNAACAILADRTVRCWGWEPLATPPLSAPAPVEGLRDVTELSMSRGYTNNTCARLLDDSVRCWGDNSRGQLGVPANPAPGLQTPVCVPGCETSAPTMSTTCAFTCVDTQTNSAHCGACNNACTDGKVCMAGMCRAPMTCPMGQSSCTPTGCVDTQTDPRHCGNCMTACAEGQVCRAGVCAAATATRIAAGENHTCVITDAGEVRCWGSDREGQRGDGDGLSGGRCSGPVMLPGTPVEITAGAAHTCVRMMDGTVRCWGRNGSGQLGNGSTTASSTPVAVMGLSNAVEIAAGGDHTCARTTDGTMVCWGAGGAGQLGPAPFVNRSSPAAVMGLSNVVEIAARVHQTCARTMDGTVRCWGISQSPIEAVGGLSDVVEIAAGDVHACARKADGTALCWGGFNTFGAQGNGTRTSSPSGVAVTGLSNAAEIAAGDDHTCARLVDGTVRCWGRYTPARVSPPALAPVAIMGLSNVVEIAAGANHTCARLQNGEVRCWGYNTQGQLGDGTTTPTSTPVLARCTGAMTAACPTGQSSCGTPAACVDPQTNASHCGGCGMACSFANAAATCANGACVLGACTTGFANCDGNAANGCETDTRSSGAHCGMCNNACATGTTCMNGSCSSTCAQTVCGSSCVDPQTNTSHCGMCNNACALANVATHTCAAGACGVGTCSAGFGNCDTNAANGCETNTQTTLAHCGMCNRACAFANAAATCANGTCALGACTTGFANCDTNAANGCETDTRSSAANCGMCGRACATGQTCVSGACVSPPGCGNGQLDPGEECDDMNGVSGDGCEPGCLRGPVCATGQVVCSNACVDTRTSTAHCGMCNNACPARANATLTCAASACGFTCATGFGNCDSNAANGCETNTTSTNAHCGACNNACPTGQTCTASACVPAMTVAGDACAMPLALDLTQTSQTVTGTTAGASTSAEGCAGGGDVFYRFTLTRREAVYVDTFGTSFDTHLGIVRGDCAMAVGACVNDACGGSQSQLVRVLDAGTYVLAVDGATGASGAFTLRVQHLPVGGGAVNELPNVSGTQMLPATTMGASAYGTSCGGGGGGPEAAWWLATCPTFAATNLTASTCGSGTFDTVLESRSAANGATTCNDDGCGSRSTIMAPLPAGAGLHVVVVDGYGPGDGGSVTVTTTLGGGGGCPTGQTTCSGSCVDTQTSPTNCGSCGTTCPPGFTCSAGMCQMGGGGCPTGQTSCFGSCVDTQSDRGNCGTCGNACSGGVCLAGTCRTYSTQLAGSTGTAGSTGGAQPFNDLCGAGWALVGFNTWAGGEMNGMAALCRQVLFDVVGGVPSMSVDTTEVARSTRGSTTGTMETVRCPTGQVAVGFSGSVGSLVSRVALRCATPTVTVSGGNFVFGVGTVTATAEVGGSPATGFGPNDCAAGAFASGASFGVNGGIQSLFLSCSRAITF